MCRTTLASESARRVRQLDYAPTTGSSAAGERRRVAVLFDTLANLYSLRLLDSLVAEAQRIGVDIVPDVISPLDPGPGRPLEPERIRDLQQRGYAGLLVGDDADDPEHPEALRRPRFPVVAVDPPNSLEREVASVGSNNWSGALQATEHLVSLGHRRIGFVGGSAEHAGLRERRGGYRSALEAAGIAEAPELVSETGMGGAGDAAARMLALDDPPTAFFVSSDPGALAVMRVVTRSGRRVPDDVSVVGYDDTYAELPAPVLLTTVHTPIVEIGRVALATVVGMVDGTAPVSSHLQLATSLVVRESTAPPPHPGSAEIAPHFRSGR